MGTDAHKSKKCWATVEYMRSEGNRANYYLAIYERIIHTGMINDGDSMEPIINNHYHKEEVPPAENAQYSAHIASASPI